MAAARSFRPVRAAALTAAALALSSLLAACKDDLGELAHSSPGAAALVASAPSVSADKVPPPPTLVAATAPASSAPSGELAGVRAQLEATLAKASACRADSECRTVATGAKACGGPTAYRAYSASAADPTKVAALAQREHDLGMAQARASGEVSACFMLADPGAHCEQNHCVTGAAGSP